MKILSYYQLKLKHLHRVEKTVNALIARRSESLSLLNIHGATKFKRVSIVSLLQVTSAASRRQFEKYRVELEDGHADIFQPKISLLIILSW